MSLPDLITKSSLRAYAIFLFLTAAVGIVVYYVYTGQLKVSGEIEAQSVWTFFVAAVGSVLGYLFRGAQNQNG